MAWAEGDRDLDEQRRFHPGRLTVYEQEGQFVFRSVELLVVAVSWSWLLCSGWRNVALDVLEVITLQCNLRMSANLDAD
jgi:hypothetical protein